MLANLVGQILDDKYQIESELGKGGMGAVYFATHLGTERPVAVKVIAPEFMKNEEFVERFRREARAAGRMRHPNVVDVTDFGFARVDTDRVAYLVMEYLDGCTLAQVLAEEEKLPLPWVADIIEQACSAVDDAHQNGIVHRDLKPDNIWLEPNRRGGYTVKVLDFGIAKVGDAAASDVSKTVINETAASTSVSTAGAATFADERSRELLELPTVMTSLAPTHVVAEPDEARTRILPPPAQTGMDEAGTQILNDTIHEEPSTILLNSQGSAARNGETDSSSGSLTRVGSILGTPLYMSPEQCRGDYSDAKSDIYSLGVIAYQMLSGKTPFKGEFSAVMTAHMELPPPPLDRKRVPKRVAGVLMRALAKNPNDRPATAAGFASELRAYSEGGMSLVRRALTMFSEHLPTFIRASLLINLPVIILTSLQLANNYLLSKRLIPSIPGIILSATLSLVILVVSFLTAGVLIGVFTQLVTQLLAVPLRPLCVRPALKVFKKRIPQFFPAAMLYITMTVVGLLLGVIPGVWVLINYSLVGSVLMMENVSGYAALRRAKSLARRSRPTVVLIVFLQFVLPLLVSATVGFIVASAIKAFNPGGLKANLFSVAFQILSAPINVTLGAFSSILTALLYLKMRQAGGESLTDAVEQFDAGEIPTTKWQLRMREKTRVTTRVGR
jgi:serine/threonine protein kinase